MECPPALDTLEIPRFKSFNSLDFFHAISFSHYGELPELLKFKYRGDRYQRVRAWLEPYVAG